MIKVNSKNCPQDHICPMIRICPKKAITQEGFNAPKVDLKKCIECGACVARCPHRVFVKE